MIDVYRCSMIDVQRAMLNEHTAAGAELLDAGCG
jgi:hypothetical protein